MDHSPRSGALPRRINRARPLWIITPPTPTTGRSGYSREEAIFPLRSQRRLHSKQRSRARELTSTNAVYNTPDSGGCEVRGARCVKSPTEDGAVIRCPECSAEIDVDEDEIEEGEILSCPECESELEVSQTHPVHLNLISDDLDEEEEEDEETEKEAEGNGDLPEEEDEEEDDEK